MESDLDELTPDPAPPVAMAAAPPVPSMTSGDRSLPSAALSTGEWAKPWQIYQSLVDSIDGIVWEADATTFNFTFVSPQAEAILGYPIAAWLQPGFWVDHLYPPDRQRATNYCQTAVGQGQNHEFEYRMMAADGRIVWLKDRVTVIVENGQPTYLRGVLFDITAQKQVELSLHDSQMQLGMAMAVAQMAIWEWDVGANVVYVLPNSAPILGLPVATGQVSWQEWLAGVCPEDRPRVEAALAQAIATGDSLSIEFRTDGSEADPRWSSSRGRVCRDEHGQPQRLVGVTLDITAQKRSEQQLRQAHHFLQTVLDNLPVAVNVKDGHPDRFGVYTFWNQTCERFFGVTAEQAIGKTVYDCFSPDEADAFHRQDCETFAQQQMVDYVERAVRSQVGERWLHTMKIPIVDEQQPSRYLLGISEDITDQIHAEEALRLRIEREALIAAITNDIRQSLDLKEILSTTVQQVRQFLQTDRVVIFRFRSSWSGAVLVESVAAGWEPLLGKVFHDPCFSESFVTLYERGRVGAIADVAATNLPDCFAHLLCSVQVQAMLTVPIKQDGKLWGLLIAHHCQGARPWQNFEIDLLKQLVEQVGIAIQQSELYLQVHRLNADLERQMQIRTAELQLASEFEATLKRITDRVRDSLDEDQILQTAVRELAISIGVTGCNAALYDLETRTSRVSYEYTDSLVPLQGRLVQMDNFPEGYRQLIQGQYFQFCSLVPNPLRGHVAMLACPIVDDKGVLGDLWLVSHKYRAFNDQDIRLVQQVANQCAIAIRQARLYQEAQAQVQELEKLNRLKDDFLSTVSHELRTPMANIKMATQMLELMLFSQASESSPTAQKASRYFQILKDECQREINLINDLLDLSRLESGVDVPTLMPMDLNRWLTQLVSPFVERARSHQQHLQLQLDPIPPLISDPPRLERVLGELLNNACKYTPAEGSIILSAQVITAVDPVTLQEVSTLKLSICNSGAEISAEELTHLFDKFYRVPNNDPWKHGGTGLGLALVKKLLEPIHGTIRATSHHGSICFIVQLPFLGNELVGSTEP